MTDRRKSEFSEKQIMAMDYCVNRGREIEKELKRIQEETGGKLLDFDTTKNLKKKEDKLAKEAAKLKTDYREAREAKKKYDYHVEEALRLKERWGFK